MKNRFLFLFLLLFSGHVLAQDTLTVMHYNLLYYGINTSFCNSQNNNVDLKDQYLASIIDYVRPDIFTVNELGRGQDNVSRILENVLNAGEEDRFSAATYTNTTNSTIVNMLYYDHNKFTLCFEAVVSNLMRDINLYTLFYNDEEGLASGDTVFLNVIVAHLKAGSEASDQQLRTSEVQAVMAYLSSSNIRGNLLFAGDFNMNSSYEQAFQHITFYPNEDIRFYDPVEQPGQWYNNATFAPYHTQSTRSGSQGCFVSGGLDDRYDLILASNAIMQGYYGLSYISDSYKALGQDGNRFNQSVIYPTNTSAPQEVIESLYGMSDHLPVIMQLKTGEISVGQPDILAETLPVTVNNPVRENLSLVAKKPLTDLRLSLYGMTGNRISVWTANDLSAGEELSINLSDLQPGIYFIQATARGLLPFSAKLIKL